MPEDTVFVRRDGMGTITYRTEACRATTAVAHIHRMTATDNTYGNRLYEIIFDPRVGMSHDYDRDIVGDFTVVTTCEYPRTEGD